MHPQCAGRHICRWRLAAGGRPRVLQARLMHWTSITAASCTERCTCPQQQTVTPVFNLLSSNSFTLMCRALMPYQIEAVENLTAAIQGGSLPAARAAYTRARYPYEQIEVRSAVARVSCAPCIAAIWCSAADLSRFAATAGLADHMLIRNPCPRRCWRQTSRTSTRTSMHASTHLTTARTARTSRASTAWSACCSGALFWGC